MRQTICGHVTSSAQLTWTMTGSDSSAACTLRKESRSRRAMMSTAVAAYSLTAYFTSASIY